VNTFQRIVEHSRKLGWLSMALVLLGTGVLFYDIPSGEIYQSWLFTFLAIAMIVTGAALDFCRRIAPRQNAPLFPARKHPTAAVMTFFVIMLLLAGALVYQLASSPPPTWRGMQIIAVSLVLLLGYGLIFYIRRMQKLEGRICKKLIGLRKLKNATV
jgi:drug/metabolite transporter (DMT)-like permease